LMNHKNEQPGRVRSGQSWG